MGLIRMIMLFMLLFCSGNCLFAQEIVTLLSGKSSDSSFYHVERINDNEYWVCGEFGILKKLDTLGHIQNIEAPAEGMHLFKILRWNNYVFLAADHGKLIRYNLLTSEWKIKSFKGFKQRCFYDFTINDQGTIVLCGGHSKIAKGLSLIHI